MVIGVNNYCECFVNIFTAPQPAISQIVKNHIMVIAEFQSFFERVFRFFPLIILLIGNTQSIIQYPVLAFGVGKFFKSFFIIFDGFFRFVFNTQNIADIKIELIVVRIQGNGFE